MLPAIRRERQERKVAMVLWREGGSSPKVGLLGGVVVVVAVAVAVVLLLLAAEDDEEAEGMA
jgi:hypothetical protein